MRVWHAANDAVRRRYAFDAPAFAGWLRRIPAVTAAWDAAPPSVEAADGPRPIFIVGMPRSGTSLVEHVLAAHSRVTPGGEQRLVPELLDKLGRCFPAEGYPDGLHHLGTEELRDLRQTALARLAAHFPGAHAVTDKLPGNFAHLGVLARIFPEATFIACERDPLDVGLSIYSQWFRESHPYAYRLDDIGTVLAGHRDVMAAWTDQLPDGSMHRVRYEDLVTDPEASITSVLVACALPVEPACFTPWTTARHVESASAPRVAAPITASRVGRSAAFGDALAPLQRALAVG